MDERVEPGEGEPIESWRLEARVRVNAVGFLPAALGAMKWAESAGPEEFESREVWVEPEGPAGEVDRGPRPAEKLPLDPEEKRARGYLVSLQLREERQGGVRLAGLQALSVELVEQPDPYETPDAWGGKESDVSKIKEETGAIWERKALDDVARAGAGARRGASL